MNVVKPDRLLVASDCDRSRNRLRIEIEFEGFTNPDQMFARMHDTIEEIKQLIEKQHEHCDCHEMESKYCSVHGVP